jgi:hypothetical protein
LSAPSQKYLGSHSSNWYGYNEHFVCIGLCQDKIFTCVVPITTYTLRCTGLKQTSTGPDLQFLGWPNIPQQRPPWLGQKTRINGHPPAAPHQNTKHKSQAGGLESHLP